MYVAVYTKPCCHLCDDVLDILDRLAPQYDLQVEQVNILDDMALYEALHDKIPVVVAGDGSMGRLVAPIDEPELRGYLDMARRSTGGGRGVLPPRRESYLDRMAARIGKHWLKYASIALAVFLALPWLAAVFAWLGWWDLANPIYTAYALTCHQLPERAGSIFGYQVAFCYRNTAIYSGLLFTGILYGLARDRHVPRLRWLLKPLPLWAFALLLVPMLVDGLTHMLGLRDPMDMDMITSFGSFLVGSQAGSLNWWLRIITGALAAFSVAWFAYPRMDRAVESSEAWRLSYSQSAAFTTATAYGDPS